LEELTPFYPKIIRDAVGAVAALPPAHVIVERHFSALKIIKFDLTVETYS